VYGPHAAKASAIRGLSPTFFFFFLYNECQLACRYRDTTKAAIGRFPGLHLELLPRTSALASCNKHFPACAPSFALPSLHYDANDNCRLSRRAAVCIVFRSNADVLSSFLALFSLSFLGSLARSYGATQVPRIYVHPMEGGRTSFW
jgi:hypothetical protein